MNTTEANRDKADEDSREDNRSKSTSTVLVVEDNDDARDMLCMLLEMHGFNTLCAKNGKEALELLKDYPNPCLILLDLMMPVMTGWEFREEQLKNPKWADIPVFILSAVSDRSSISELHAQAYLNKPLDFQALTKGLSRYCFR